MKVQAWEANKIQNMALTKSKQETNKVQQTKQT